MAMIPAEILNSRCIASAAAIARTAAIEILIAFCNFMLFSSIKNPPYSINCIIEYQILRCVYFLVFYKVEKQILQIKRYL